LEKEVGKGLQVLKAVKILHRKNPVEVGRGKSQESATVIFIGVQKPEKIPKLHLGMNVRLDGKVPCYATRRG